MNCPRCGYVMSDLDVECPRCARMQATATSPGDTPSQKPPAALPPTTEQAGRGGVPRHRHITVNDNIAWLAGCCPFIAIAIQLLASSVGGASGWVVFGVVLSINGAILEADRKYLESLEFDTSSLQVWLIPSYLFNRAALVGESPAYAYLWCVLFCVSFLIPIAS